MDTLGQYGHPSFLAKTYTYSIDRKWPVVIDGLEGIRNVSMNKLKRVNYLECRVYGPAKTFK